MSAAGTPKASEAAVAAVQDALGCDLTPRQTRAIAVDGVRVGGHVETGCRIHRDQYGFPLKSERGCPVAVAAADAASPHIAAQTLRDAAESIGEDGISRFIGMDPLPAAVRAEKRAQVWLHARADRIEATHAPE